MKPDNIYVVNYVRKFMKFAPHIDARQCFIVRLEKLKSSSHYNVNIIICKGNIKKYINVKKIPPGLPQMSFSMDEKHIKCISFWDLVKKEVIRYDYPGCVEWFDVVRYNHEGIRL